jgi:hypothetical protein
MIQGGVLLAKRDLSLTQPHKCVHVMKLEDYLWIRLMNREFIVRISVVMGDYINNY